MKIFNLFKKKKNIYDKINDYLNTNKNYIKANDIIYLSPKNMNEYISYIADNNLTTSFILGNTFFNGFKVYITETEGYYTQEIYCESVERVIERDQKINDILG